MTEKDGIKKYGRILRKEIIGDSLLFKNADPVGWRIAEVVVDNQDVITMSYHDNTPECFFPVEGLSTITLSLDDSFDNCDTFALDEPLLINKCVWHGIASLSGGSRIIVVENESVNMTTKNTCSREDTKT